MSFASSVVCSTHSPLQTLTENKPSDSPSSLPQGDSTPSEIKPLSLPSLASLTNNLSSSIPSSEQSQFGPHRTCSVGISSGRRFSPLSSSIDYADSVSPLDSEHPSSLFGEGRPSLSGISMIMASTHRPRSRSFLSGPSLVGNSAEFDAHIDESASDSSSSDKKNEDNDSTALSKKRSRTLTTPSQQRRLMQILEQTRFPSTDVREQLARELGMTPRRVQIWFQNRRQGMKKAQHKTDHETSATQANNFHRSRGFSFGAYPTSAEIYSQSGLHALSQTKFIPSAVPAHNASPVSLSKSSDQVDGQEELYAPRSVSRGVPRNLHLQLSSDHCVTSTQDGNGGSVSDFMWTDPSTATSAYSGSSAVDNEVNFSPFAQVNHQNHIDSLSQPLPYVSTSRHRSQTNPDIFGIMNGFIGLPGPGQMSSEAINPLQQSPEANTQRSLFGVGNLCADKNDTWASGYSQPASNWRESFESLKQPEASSYVSDQSMYHLYNNPGKPPEASAGFYYPSRNHESMMEDDHGFSTLQLAPEGVYGTNMNNPTGEPDLSNNDASAILLAQHHLRQRSQSLNSFV